MKKITFGTPERIVPSNYCKGFCYRETDVTYDIGRISFKETARGCVVEFPLKESEAVYGFGLQLKGFDHKRNKLLLRTNSDPVAYTGDSHAPVPFFVTTEGYGMYLDTARYIEVQCGYSKKQRRSDKKETRLADNAESLYVTEETAEETVMSIEIPVAKGIDIYLFTGETILDIVSEYNMLSGGGCSVSDWGVGVIYRTYLKYNSEQVLALADYFREKHIPCDIIGLEPGWQTDCYSCSYVWDPERFPDPKATVQCLKERNFHVSLWEHAFVRNNSPLYPLLYDLSGDYEVWQGVVPDFGLEEAQDIFAKYHRETMVELGVDAFKLDECDSSDYRGDWSFPSCAQFPSGMDGEQYHQMFGTLYMQAILKALGETKTLSQVRQAGALASSYPFVLYSDLYDHKDFIRGTVNSGFSGILWTPEVRDAKSSMEFLRRLQTTVFSVQCLINAWYCEEVPWKEHGCEKEVIELLQVRKALEPMLLEAFKEYRETGKPPVRALVADYTSDKETWKIDDEYIFCDELIVAPLTEETDERRVYLPEGKWRDYWTKEPVSPGWFDVLTKKIPVYEKIHD